MKDHSQHNKKSQYKKNSLTLVGAVSMGTGVMNYYVSTQGLWQ